jgi:hypothetical protein
MQILDAAVLDYNVLRFEENGLAAAVIYITLGKFFYDTDYRLLSFRCPSPATGCINEYDNISAYFGDGTNAPNT